MLSSFSRLYVTIFRDVFSRRLCLTTLALLCLACDGVSRPDDTLGLQSAARWEWHGRLVVEGDSALTLVRMGIDTTHGGGDVGLARYDFNPAVGEGDEYSLTLGLDLANVRDLRQNVPYAPGFIARLANRLHARTRAGVIRATLLVNPGDRYDSARVAESERALRNLSVFSRVRIDTTRLDGRLALRVATTDGWSTKPQLGYSSAGGDVTWMVGLVEDNLLGTAPSLTAVYSKTPDRRVFDLGHVNPHFFSRRGWLQAKYSNKSDGDRGTWLVGLPFYETAARLGVTTDGEAASERVLLFRDGLPDTTQFSQGQVERRALWFGLTAGFAPRVTTEDYVRLWLAGQWRRENFDSVGTTAFPRSVLGTVGVGMDVGHVRFQVLERFNSYARREDVDISQLLHIGVWAAPRAWGYPSGQAGDGPELR